MGDLVTRMKHRKTITFPDDLHEAIQQKRAQVLLKGIEKNFTETVIELCRKGLEAEKMKRTE